MCAGKGSQGWPVCVLLGGVKLPEIQKGGCEIEKQSCEREMEKLI